MTQSEKADQVYRSVSRTIKHLEETKGSPETKALLANLRHGAGKSPAQLPDVWGTVLEGLSFIDENSRKISPEENAVYLTMTLYALGCQGQDSKSQKIQQPGVSLGQAVGLLVRKDPQKLRNMQIRMKSLLNSRDYTQMGVKLRTLISMICKDGGLDFPLLAKDLYWMGFPNSRNMTGISWARAFVRTVTLPESDEEKKGEDHEKE